MGCEKCQDKGFTEREHGLIMAFCDCEKGKALRAETIGETPDVPATGGQGGTEDTHIGILFQLNGKRTDEYSDDELWKMAEEVSLEGLKFPHRMVMPCGEVVRFDSPSSFLNLIPVNLMCGCGNPNHYIVRFDDNREVSNDDRSNIGTQPVNQPIGSPDTSKPKQSRKPKAKKKARARAR